MNKTDFEWIELNYPETKEFDIDWHYEVKYPSKDESRSLNQLPKVNFEPDDFIAVPLNSQFDAKKAKKEIEQIVIEDSDKGDYNLEDVTLLHFKRDKYQGFCATPKVIRKK